MTFHRSGASVNWPPELSPDLSQIQDTIVMLAPHFLGMRTRVGGLADRLTSVRLTIVLCRRLSVLIAVAVVFGRFIRPTEEAQDRRGRKQLISEPAKASPTSSVLTKGVGGWCWEGGRTFRGDALPRRSEPRPAAGAAGVVHTAGRSCRSSSLRWAKEIKKNKKGAPSVVLALVCGP